MKIICIGNNYPDKENNQKPFFYSKPETCLIKNNRPFFIPDFSDNFLISASILIRTNRLGKHIQEKFAHKYYNEIGLGIDFLAPNLKKECIEQNIPQDISFAFDGSSPISKFFPINEISDINNIDFNISIDENTIIKGNTNKLILDINKTIEYVSKFTTIKIGDLIYIGLPTHTEKISKNTRVKGSINNNEVLNFLIK